MMAGRIPLKPTHNLDPCQQETGMPRHFEKRLVPYSCAQMFALVADVARYPEFLPWCLEAEVTRANDQEMRAILAVGFKSLRDTFTSLVHLDAPNTIKVTYGGGPLQRLQNEWTFTPTPDGGCEIAFLVDFAFKSFLLGAMMDLFFDKAFRTMVSAFEQRAKELYA